MIVLAISLFLHENVNSVTDKDRFSIGNYVENPQKYGGINGEHLVKIVNISQDHFYINFGNRDVKVIGNIERPTLGESTVFLNYKKNGVIELIDFHNYNYNYVLYGFSVFAFILFIIIFFMEWKITWRGFEDA